jgi:hypothetical protein
MAGADRLGHAAGSPRNRLRVWSIRPVDVAADVRKGRTMRTTVLVVLGCLGLASACVSVREVERTRYGGVLALRGFRDEAMKQADQMMATRCGRENYTIVREFEATIGSDSRTTGTATLTPGVPTPVALSTPGPPAVPGIAPTATTTGDTSTRDVTEWRVQYECGAGGAATAGPPGTTTPQAK